MDYYPLVGSTMFYIGYCRITTGRVFFPAVSCQGADYVVFGEILYLLPDMLRQSHWTVTLRKNAPSGTTGIVSFLTVKSGPTGRESP